MSTQQEMADKLVALLLEYHIRYGTPHPREFPWDTKERWSASDIVDFVNAYMASRVLH